jgi:hypothetical protein
MLRSLICAVAAMCGLTSLCINEANAEKRQSWASTEMRETFIRDCTRRGSERGNQTAHRLCSCSFDVLENGMTLAEYKELEASIRSGKPDELPQMRRIMPKLKACKDR